MSSAGVQRFFVSKRVSNAGDDLPNKIQALGGNITYSGGYKIHTFTNTVTDSFNVLWVPDNSYRNLEYLVVAGGGGGGTDIDVGGGGGGGGLLTGSMSGYIGTYVVTVGSGGSRGTGPDVTGTGGGSNGTQGSSSVFGSIITIGGGYGGTRGQNGGSGGSGGGGGDFGGLGGAGTAGQGNAGGAAPAGNSNSGADTGGGGGAGGAATAPNNPGPGLFSSIGNATFSAGGRGAQLVTALAGGNNTGDGGYGARNGGSGIVIIRYPS